MTAIANQQNQANRASSNPFELQLKHSQSLMVPNTSYGQHRQTTAEDYVNQLPIHQQNNSGSGHYSSNHQLDIRKNSGADALLDDSHIEFSLDQQGVPFNHYLNAGNQMSSKDVANPYAAAKRRLYRSSQKNEGLVDSERGQSSRHQGQMKKVENSSDQS